VQYSGEETGSVWFDDCDLSVPSKKGHAGCVDDAIVDGTPYAVRLVPSDPSVPTAIAYVKK
jgi:hypothetical protein